MKLTFRTLIAGISLCLCILVCILWLRSSRSSGDDWFIVRDLPQDSRLHDNFTAQHNWTLRLMPGFSFAWESKDWKRWHNRRLTLPYAVPVLLLAIGPLLWGRQRWRAARRSAQGRCIACGYDLRASPGRCPECGRAITSERQKFAKV